MEKTVKLIEFKTTRTIDARAEDLYDAWLNPKIPGTPWNKAERVIMQPEVNTVFWFEVLVDYPHAHYGRFLRLDPSRQIVLTWVSQNTAGLESTITVTFDKKENGTLMTLVHTGLPDTSSGRDHQDGWNYFMDLFAGQFSKKKK